MAGFWEEAKYWLDILSSHGVGVKAVSEVCPLAGGLSRRRLSKIIVVVVGPLYTRDVYYQELTFERIVI